MEIYCHVESDELCFNLNSLNDPDTGSTLVEVGDGPSNSKSGTYTYITPEGEEVQMDFVADENGYQATGSHIPQQVALPDGDPNGPGGARNNLKIWESLMQVGRR